MICSVCTATKLPGDFYPGNKSVCKECIKIRVRTRARTNPAVQEYDRVRAKTPERKARNRANVVKWRTNNPDSYRAETAVGNAVRDGKLQKQPCAMCGTDKNIHAHHKDYSRPLDVTWLCAKCHHRLHAAFPELGGHYEVAT